MARGNRARAARLLQATRRIVNYKITQYGIDWKRYQDSNRAERVQDDSHIFGRTRSRDVHNCSAVADGVRPWQGVTR